MTPRTLHEVTTLVCGAAAALIPAAAGGRDADGRQVMDRARAVLKAKECLRAALDRLEAVERGEP